VDEEPSTGLTSTEQSSSDFLAQFREQLESIVKTLAEKHPEWNLKLVGPSYNIVFSRYEWVYRVAPNGRSGAVALFIPNPLPELPLQEYILRRLTTEHLEKQIEDWINKNPR